MTINMMKRNLYIIDRTILALVAVLAICGPAEGQTKSARAEDPAKKAASAFEAGQNAHQAGNLDEAIRLYTQALALDAGLWQAEFQRGAAYRSVGKLSEAKKSITGVLELLKEYADSPELRGIRARAQMMLGDIAAAEGRTGEAETAYRSVLELDPVNAGARAALSDLYLSTGKPADAAREAAEAIRAGEDSPGIFVIQAVALGAIGRTEDALASYGEALRREPDNSRALDGRSGLYLKLGRTAEAIADLRRLVSHDPRFKSVLAAALAETGGYDEAIGLYRSALESDGSNPEARTGLAALLIRAGREKEAIAELESLIKAEPNRADLQSQLGELYLASDPEKALAGYTAAAKIEPDKPGHLIGVGSALVRLKRYPEAIGALRKALSMNPGPKVEYFVHTNLATALFEMDDFANAAREFLWILKYQEGEGNRKRAAISLYFLGICFDKLGDYEQALKAYQNFLSLAAPENQLEVEKIKLRLPSLQRQIREGKGKRKNQE